MPSETIDYIFVPDPNNLEDFCVKLLTPEKYKGVVYKYGKIQFRENFEKDECTLEFIFGIMYCPDNLEKGALMNDVTFKNYLGDILNDILANNKFETKPHGEQS
jgi:hypothetical protein